MYEVVAQFQQMLETLLLGVEAGDCSLEQLHFL